MAKGYNWLAAHGTRADARATYENIGLCYTCGRPLIDCAHDVISPEAVEQRRIMQNITSEAQEAYFEAYFEATPQIVDDYADLIATQEDALGRGLQ